MNQNPEPIRIVSDGRRDAWRPYVQGWRCEYEDGRGRCTSRETKTEQAADGTVHSYCVKHG